MLRIICCGRPCFEGLLQQIPSTSIGNNVVEDLVLKGYYNSYPVNALSSCVVEDLVLKGYYNCISNAVHISELWKTLF